MTSRALYGNSSESAKVVWICHGRDELISLGTSQFKYATPCPVAVYALYVQTYICIYIYIHIHIYIYRTYIYHAEDFTYLYVVEFLYIIESIYHISIYRRTIYCGTSDLRSGMMRRCIVLTFILSGRASSNANFYSNFVGFKSNSLIGHLNTHPSLHWFLPSLPAVIRYCSSLFFTFLFSYFFLFISLLLSCFCIIYLSASNLILLSCGRSN